MDINQEGIAVDIVIEEDPTEEEEMTIAKVMGMDMERINMMSIMMRLNHSTISLWKSRTTITMRKKKRKNKILMMKSK